MIPYGRQSLDQSDIDAVVDVLRSDWLTQGPLIEKFENAVCGYTGTAHAVAVNSATSALHVACLALGLNEDGRLWTSPITFVSSANCALYCGASVDFVDIDPDTYNISVSALKEKLVEAKKNNTLPDVVIPVHFSGQSCDMKVIHELAKQYGFKIIEDASHAIGGKYLNKPVGDCSYSDITVFSFHPVKIITTGEGGMALTNDIKLADKMKLLRSHGITRDPSLLGKNSEGPWYYQQIDLGFNFRITDLQAALGLSQLKKLDTFIKRRHELADNYNTLLSELPVVIPVQKENTFSAFHLYVIKLKLDKINHTRKKVFESLRAVGINVNVHYIPVHTQAYYKSLGFKKGDYPEAEEYYTAAITLPLYPDLTETQQQEVVAALKNALGYAS